MSSDWSGMLPYVSGEMSPDIRFILSEIWLDLVRFGRVKFGKVNLLIKHEFSILFFYFYKKKNSINLNPS